MPVLSLILKWRDNTVLITQGCNLHNYLCASRLDFACTPPFRHVVRCKGRCLQGHEIPFVIYTAASRLFNYWLLKKVGRKSFIYQWLPTKSDIFAFWCVDHWKITCYSVYEHYIRQLFLQYCMCIIIHICAFSSEITHQISHFRVLVGNQWAELHLFVNNCPINPENQPTRVQTRIRLIFTRWVYGEIEPLKQKQNGAVSTFVLRQPHDKNVNCCLNVLSSAPLPWALRRPQQESEMSLERISTSFLGNKFRSPTLGASAPSEGMWDTARTYFDELARRQVRAVSHIPGMIISSGFFPGGIIG